MWLLHGFAYGKRNCERRKLLQEMLGELFAIVGMANETNALAAGFQVEVDERFKVHS